MSTKRMRLQALERVVGAALVGGVVTYDPEVETQEQALARASAAGRSGAVLLMPEMAAADEWERSTAANQRALMAAAELHLRDTRRPEPPAPARPKLTPGRG